MGCIRSRRKRAPASIQFVGSYTPEDSGGFEWDGGTGTLSFGSVIPEPGTLGLLGLAGLAALLRKRRR